MIAALALSIALFSAQEATPQENLDALLSCQTIETDADRLACFDKRATAISTLRAVARDATPGSGFGDEQLERVQEARRDARAEEPKSFDAEVEAITYDARGYAIFTLKNGQVWKQKNEAVGSARLREGEEMTVRISRRLFGGYRLKVLKRGPIFNVERIK